MGGGGNITFDKLLPGTNGGGGNTVRGESVLLPAAATLEVAPLLLLGEAGGGGSVMRVAPGGPIELFETTTTGVAPAGRMLGGGGSMATATMGFDTLVLVLGLEEGDGRGGGGNITAVFTGAATGGGKTSVFRAMGLIVAAPGGICVVMLARTERSLAAAAVGSVISGVGRLLMVPGGSITSGCSDARALLGFTIEDVPMS